MVNRTGRPLAAVVLCMGLMGAMAPVSMAQAAEPAKAVKTSKAKAKAKPSRTSAFQKIETPWLVGRLAEWVAKSGDNQGLPYAIIDKGTATTFVFDAEGKLLGGDASLIGLTPGDDSTPGIGDRELSDMPPEVRITPAGRFIGSYGPAPGKGQVLWVDFATAISLHPVVTTKPKERRVQRLKSPTWEDNRITFGCINVSPAFYSQVVKPTFRKTKGIFYILPEHRSLGQVFPQFDYQMQTRSPGVEVSATEAPSAPLAR